MKHLVALLLLSGILKTNLLLSQQNPSTSEISIDKTEDVICKDSLGNPITYKEAVALLKTGKYVSIPALNNFMQVEHTIKKPTKEEKEKYQTYTGGGTVISTSGSKRIEMKYNLGDIIPPIKAQNFFDEQFALNQNDPNKKILLMFLKESTRWDDTEPQLSVLMTNYPDVSFIVCPDKEKEN